MCIPVAFEVGYERRPRVLQSVFLHYCAEQQGGSTPLLLGNTQSEERFKHHKLQPKHLCESESSFFAFSQCVQVCTSVLVSIYCSVFNFCVCFRSVYVCVCVCVCVCRWICVLSPKKKKKRKVKHPTLSSSKTVFLCTHNCPPTIATNLWVYFSPSAREYFTICVSICITNTPPPPPSSSPLSAAGYLHVIIPNLRWKKKKLLRITLLFAKSPLDQIAKLAELHYNTKSNCI